MSYWLVIAWVHISLDLVRIDFLALVQICIVFSSILVGRKAAETPSVGKPRKIFGLDPVSAFFLQRNNFQINKWIEINYTIFYSLIPALTKETHFD